MATLCFSFSQGPAAEHRSPVLGQISEQRGSALTLIWPERYLVLTSSSSRQKSALVVPAGHPAQHTWSPALHPAPPPGEQCEAAWWELAGGHTDSSTGSVPGAAPSQPALPQTGPLEGWEGPLGDLVPDVGSGPTNSTPKQDLGWLHGADCRFELTGERAAFPCVTLMCLAPHHPRPCVSHGLFL